MFSFFNGTSKNNRYNYNVLIEYGYEHFPKACVNGENIVKYPNLSVDDCKIRCNERDDCVAFEYGVSYGGSGNYNPRDCNLQSGSDKSGCNAGHHNLDLYVKKGIDVLKNGFIKFNQKESN